MLYYVSGLQVYEFTVIARDGGKVSLEGYAKVSVTLIDVNDNHPVFEPAKYQVTVLEHTPLKTTLIHSYMQRTMTNQQTGCSPTVSQLVT